MARVEITEEELRSASFPAVCAKTGETTNHIAGYSVRLPHPFAYWLLVAGGIPFFVYLVFVAPRMTCSVPMSQSIVELRSRQRRFLASTAFVSLGVIGFAGLVLDGVGQLIVISAGLLIAIAAQIALLAVRRDATIQFTRTRYDTVVMDRIHPAFRDALANGDRTQDAGASPAGHIDARPISHYRPSRSA